MALAQQRHQHALDDRALADDDSFDLLDNPRGHGLHARHIRRRRPAIRITCPTSISVLLLLARYAQRGQTSRGGRSASGAVRAAHGYTSPVASAFMLS